MERSLKNRTLKKMMEDNQSSRDPLKKTQKHKQGGPTHKTPAKTEKSGNVRKPVVLVVDDNKETQAIVSAMLKGLGCQAATATTGEQALAFFNASDKKIDLIISDIVMPGEDGPDIIDRIVALRPDIKVIFMSGYDEDEIVHDSVYKIQHSNAAFLSKPFTIIELAALLNDQLD